MIDDDYMLTTVDNPWNPHSHYDQWSLWDRMHGYNTESMLARMIQDQVNDVTDEQKLSFATTLAIEQILECNYEGIYAKVFPEDPCPMVGNVDIFNLKEA